MRLLVLIAGLALAVTTLAEEKPRHKSVAKELDKSSPVMANEAPSDDPAEATEAREKMDKEKNKSKTRAKDYNSSRSNTSSLMETEKTETDDPVKNRHSERNKGQQGDEASGGKRKGGTDYNSSRSNNVNAAEDDIDDDDDDEGNDPAIRKNPDK